MGQVLNNPSYVVNVHKVERGMPTQSLHITKMLFIHATRWSLKPENVKFSSRYV